MSLLNHFLRCSSLLLLIVIGSNSANPLLAQPEQVVPPSDLERMVHNLSNPNYAARSLATEQLLRLGADAVPALERGLSSADADTATRMVQILGELAVDPRNGPGQSAVESLRRISSSRITIPAVLATRVLSSLTEEQRRKLEVELVDLGARSGIANVQILTKRVDGIYLMVVDSRFRGESSDLYRLSWMQGLEHLQIDGPKVNADWLEHVGRMPSLRVLQIRHAKLIGEDFKRLENLEQLETLEILYSAIDDSAVESLARLPIGGRMRIFGTQITPVGIERLRTYLSGIEIIHGKGGFLGVSMAPNTSVIGDLVTGGAARKAGLLAGDRILSINGKSITVFEELQKELSNYRASEVVQVRIERHISSTETVIDTIPVALGEQQ